MFSSSSRRASMSDCYEEAGGGEREGEERSDEQKVTFVGWF